MSLAEELVIRKSMKDTDEILKAIANLDHLYL